MMIKCHLLIQPSNKAICNLHIKLIHNRFDLKDIDLKGFIVLQRQIGAFV
mgnify:CR=1 FL=1